MADIRTIVDTLMEAGPNRKIRVDNILDENDYHTIRTGLVKRWAERKEGLLAISEDDGDTASLSLCGDYNAADGTATFYLGKSRRKAARSYSFVLVDSTEPAGVNSNVDNSQ